MIKLISGGGSSYADAVKNMSNKIDVFVCKEKCKFILSNVPSFKGMSEDDSSDLSVEQDEFKKWVFFGESGGTIVFSTDVNSATFSNNKVKDWIYKKFLTLKNRFSIKNFLTRLRLKENIAAWTIGQYFIGSYTGSDGKTYDERSYTLNVIGIDRKELFKLAQEIREFLKQESVLVHDAKTKQVYFVTEK